MAGGRAHARPRQRTRRRRRADQSPKRAAVRRAFLSFTLLLFLFSLSRCCLDAPCLLRSHCSLAVPLLTLAPFSIPAHSLHRRRCLPQLPLCSSSLVFLLSDSRCVSGPLHRAPSSCPNLNHCRQAGVLLRAQGAVAVAGHQPGQQSGGRRRAARAHAGPEHWLSARGRRA